VIACGNQKTDRGGIQASAAHAWAIVIMDVERGLGFEPTGHEFEKVGYYIESGWRKPASFYSSRSRAASAERSPSRSISTRSSTP